MRCFARSRKFDYRKWISVEYKASPRRTIHDTGFARMQAEFTLLDPFKSDSSWKSPSLTNFAQSGEHSQFFPRRQKVSPFEERSCGNSDKSANLIDSSERNRNFTLKLWAKVGRYRINRKFILGGDKRGSLSPNPNLNTLQNINESQSARRSDPCNGPTLLAFHLPSWIDKSDQKVKQLSAIDLNFNYNQYRKDTRITPKHFP